MTNQNNAAQAAEQEIDAIMEQAQVFASAWAFLGGPFDNGSGLETAEREKANLRALLSKLRAPVADEQPRQRPPMCRISGVNEGVLRRAAMRHRAADELQDPSVLAGLADGLESIAGNENAALAAAYIRREADRLASAPIAPQACPTDVCQAGKADGVLCANDECDRANGVRPASAPVAGEAVAVVRDNPEDHGTIIDALVALPVGTQLYAAPQASEAVRDAEDAERWRWATAIDENAQTLHSIVLCHGGDQQKINERADFYRAALSAQPGAQKNCNCATCRPHSVEMRMILCESCGDKRCPHAADHRNECVGTGVQKEKSDA